MAAGKGGQSPNLSNGRAKGKTKERDALEALIASATTRAQHAIHSEAEALQQLITKVLIAYNTSSADQNELLDTGMRGVQFGAPVLQPAGGVGKGSMGGRQAAGTGHVPMHARLLPGTVPCVTQHMADALSCLGGITVVLPFFCQLDHPIKVDLAVYTYLLSLSCLSVCLSVSSFSLPCRHFNHILPHLILYLYIYI